MRGSGVRRAFAWFGAIVAYAALVDLCVETFAAGSALRWYVSVVSVAFVAVTGLLWRRDRAGANAEYAAVVVTALVAYAGWALGFGDARTLHALGQPTRVVVASVLVVALLASAGRLALRRGVPALPRIAAGALAAYAALPFVIASLRGDLDAAFDGTALGVPGPFWTRGAYLGVEILLPLAVLAFAIASVVAWLRRDPRTAASDARVAIAVLLVVQTGALELTTLGLPSLASFERPHGAAVAFASVPRSQAPPTAIPVSTATQAASGGGIANALGGAMLDASDALGNASHTPRQRVAAFLAKVAIAQRYVRRADFDASALAATLPADPNALFAFVRDTIALDAYAGAMRGANGTLMSRAGSADDKALLLAALFRAKAIAVRFARSTLSAGDVGDLANAARAATLAPAPTAKPDAFFTDLGLDPERTRRSVAARDAADTAYVRAGLAFANERAPALWAMVANADHRNAAADASDALAQSRSHAFVQASVAGRWIDFDPSLPRLQPGAHLGSDAVETAAALAPERFHTLRVRFDVVYGTGARREESTALDRTIRTSDLGGTPIALGIASPSTTSLETVASARTFAPFVDVGSSGTTGTTFALRDARGRELQSARLVLETAGPGVVATAHARVLWDAASGREPALGLARTYDMLVVPGPYGDAFCEAMLLDTVARMKSLWLYTATPPAERVLPAVRDLQPAYPLALLDYVNRDVRIAHALEAQTPTVRFTFDRPDVVMLASGFERVGDAVRGVTTFDIVDNGMRADGADPGAARLANVERGLLDTYVEQHVLTFLRSPAVGAPQAFAQANRSGVDTLVVNAAYPLPAGVPARSVAPLRETLARGEVAIATRVPVTLAGTSHYAWWAIDPRSGNTVGRLDDGSGEDLEEESFLLTWAKRIGMAYTLIGIVINGPQSVEDAEIGIFLGGASVIGEALAALKSAYEIGGGDYGAGGADGGAPPANGGSSPSWGP